jgi:hypothetical protein
VKYRFFIYWEPVSGQPPKSITSFWAQGIQGSNSNYPYLFFPERLINTTQRRMSFILPGPKDSKDSQYLIGAFINAFNREYGPSNKIAKTSVQETASSTPAPAKVDTTLPPNPAMYVPPTQTTELHPEAEEEFISTGINFLPFIVIGGLVAMVIAATKKKKKRK